MDQGNVLMVETDSGDELIREFLAIKEKIERLEQEFFKKVLQEMGVDESEMPGIKEMIDGVLKSNAVYTELQLNLKKVEIRMDTCKKNANIKEHIEMESREVLLTFEELGDTLAVAEHGIKQLSTTLTNYIQGELNLSNEKYDLSATYESDEYEYNFDLETHGTFFIKLSHSFDELQDHSERIESMFTVEPKCKVTSKIDCIRKIKQCEEAQKSLRKELAEQELQNIGCDKIEKIAIISENEFESNLRENFCNFDSEPFTAINELSQIKKKM